ncbi:TraX family protein [[Clostridium] polysaccharolyticum]|uniref:TraX protein n=1 Tax=[Clostridium] polysaccharolyticum TaxID=29364 RepID=A0A1I0ARY3_9FIRM|nr:TraX family protein [[Clostridium] polysaccharolyticum]SES97106.1 TraX protein [[Clostridium] polysaccharolyticum]
MKQKKLAGLSGGQLKILALVTMIIDHFTAVFVDYNSYGRWYWIGRGIGRLSFPIYCFLIVEGFFHTRSIRKYGTRLFLFALISEVPYDLAFYGTVFEPHHQNVFFTLGLGIVLMSLVQVIPERFGEKKVKLENIVLLAAYALVFLVSYLVKGDYEISGLVLIYLMYLVHGNRKNVAFSNIVVNVMTGFEGIQMLGAVSAVPVYFYNGKKGISLKYFFYVIYPLHLLLFYWIKNFVM